MLALLEGAPSNLREQTSVVLWARALKAELLDEKKEKQSMAKELIAAQIGANEKATAQQLRLNELEQQNLATSDVLAQLEVREAEGAAKLKAAVEAEEEGARRVRRAEQARRGWHSRAPTQDTSDAPAPSPPDPACIARAFP